MHKIIKKQQGGYLNPSYLPPTRFDSPSALIEDSNIK
jgi:hypothetical protein